VAIASGLDVAAFIKENPVQKELTAMIKPLSESRLPKLIEENLSQDTAQKKDRGPGEDLDQGYDWNSGIGR
jgi:hypothetical protein